MDDNSKYSMYETIYKNLMNEEELLNQTFLRLKEKGILNHFQAKFISEVTKIVEQSEINCLKPYRNIYDSTANEIASQIVVQYLFRKKLGIAQQTANYEIPDFFTMRNPTVPKLLKIYNNNDSYSESNVLHDLLKSWNETKDQIIQANKIKMRKEIQTKFELIDKSDREKNLSNRNISIKETNSLENIDDMKLEQDHEFYKKTDLNFSKDLLPVDDEDDFEVQIEKEFLSLSGSINLKAELSKNKLTSSDEEIISSNNDLYNSSNNDMNKDLENEKNKRNKSGNEKSVIDKSINENENSYNENNIDENSYNENNIDENSFNDIENGNDNSINNKSIDNGNADDIDLHENIKIKSISKSEPAINYATPPMTKSKKEEMKNFFKKEFNYSSSNLKKKRREVVTLIPMRLAEGNGSDNVHTSFITKIQKLDFSESDSSSSDGFFSAEPSNSKEENSIDFFIDLDEDDKKNEKPTKKVANKETDSDDFDDAFQ